MGRRFIAGAEEAWEPRKRWWDENGPEIAEDASRWGDAIVEHGQIRADTMATTWEGMGRVMDFTVRSMSTRSAALSTVWDSLGNSWDFTVRSMSIRSEALSTYTTPWSGGGSTFRSHVHGVKLGWGTVRNCVELDRGDCTKSLSERAKGVRGVTGVITGVINGVVGKATDALNSAIRVINAAIGSYNRIPGLPNLSAIPAASRSGLNTRTIGSLPRLHTGGRVAGPPGTDQMRCYEPVKQWDVPD